MASNENIKFGACKNKLEALCEENHLTCAFLSDGYPIKLVVRPCADVDNQMSILEDMEADGTGYISADASITLYVRDGEMGERVKGTFDISDALKSKIKNLFKQMHYLYLQMFQRRVIAQKGSVTVPFSIAKPDKAEPVEEYEQDTLGQGDWQ